MAIALALCGCATGPHVTTLDAVGPKSPAVHPSGQLQGWLKVYSATNEINAGGLMYYPHTGYSIYRSNGTRCKRVENHASPGDESPEVVALPAGDYYVLARSDFDGMVKVPVLIKGGQTTVVNLEPGSTGGSGATSKIH